MNQFEKFKQLHQNPAPFLLGNIWDIKSAQVFEAGGYKAIGVSSQALSNAMGYEDGENLPFEVLHHLAKRVVEAVNIPFSVDMEAGYSRSIEGIINNIDQLHDVGVVGINLEDTIPGTPRSLQSVTDFQRIIAAVAEHVSRNNMQLFLNIRTDGFLLGMPNALEETLSRVKIYEGTGADSIFVPCITAKADIATVVSFTKLPVNVMCMPNLPGFNELSELGVKRISMGPFHFNKVYNTAAKLADEIILDQSFSSLFS